ncbi:MAG TPA: hypothetical protein VHU92_16385 [Streptosporangiaceae bacterium]|jgi:hypothetical protein|nr:hypothetical protein [Streptosporangiaceae bacterium]
MQPVAILAVTAAVVMVLGVSVTLAAVRRPGQAKVRRWYVQGSMPLAGAGLVLGVISRSGGQTSATHNVMYLTATVLLVGAFLCALAGASAATRGR